MYDSKRNLIGNINRKINNNFLIEKKETQPIYNYNNTIKNINIRASLVIGLIFIFISSDKPRIKNRVQKDKYSKKNIFLNNKKSK